MTHRSTNWGELDRKRFDLDIALSRYKAPDWSILCYEYERAGFKDRLIPSRLKHSSTLREIAKRHGIEVEE